MCEARADPGAVAAVTPRSAAGEAVDPINLEPVDSVEITTLVDNSFDALLTRRASSYPATAPTGELSTPWPPPCRTAGCPTASARPTP